MPCQVCQERWKNVGQLACEEACYAPWDGGFRPWPRRLPARAPGPAGSSGSAPALAPCGRPAPRGVCRRAVAGSQSAVEPKGGGAAGVGPARGHTSLLHGQAQLCRAGQLMPTCRSPVCQELEEAARLILHPLQGPRTALACSLALGHPCALWQRRASCHHAVQGVDNAAGQGCQVVGSSVSTDSREDLGGRAMATGVGVVKSVMPWLGHHPIN
jgi:hypothetical protein